MDKGVIYMITCNANGKKYIGQAVNFVGQNNVKWGTEGRWKSHVREAIYGKKDHCTHLNNAIRKYGPENFTTETLCESLISELNSKEEEFISLHDTANPNKGYNLKRGGGQAEFTEESNKRRSESKKGVIHSKEACQKMSTNQIGNRREKKNRKYPEDANLPKYVTGIREKGMLVGYAIQSYPIGINKKDYIDRRVLRRNNPDEALQIVIVMLDELKSQYEEKVNKAISDRKTKEHMEAISKSTIVKNQQNTHPDDEYILPIPVPENPNKFKGYIVKGLVDSKGKDIPAKVFDDVTNRWCLDRARKYIKQVKSLVENQAYIDDWSKVDTIYKSDKKGVETENLPKYINVCYYKGEKSGYVVNGYPLPNGKKSCVKFTNTRYNTLEDLYEQALAYLEELKRKYPIKK